MKYATYKSLKAERTANVLTITMNRPEELNAINEPLYYELSTIFVDASMDKEVDVVVFTGAGRAFSAGGDWNWMREQIADPNAFLSSLVAAKRMIYSILDCEKPVICALNGDAVGLGCTLALYCDFVIAVDSARLADPHVRVGLVAGDGGAVAWTNYLGHMRAKKYLLTGDFISATDAETVGLITTAVPQSEFEKTVDALVAKMAKAATQSVGWTKAVINAGLRQALDGTINGALAYEALSNTTPDHTSAVEAFLKHERPVFESHARSADANPQQTGGSA